MHKRWLDFGWVTASGVVALGLVVLLARAAPIPGAVPFDARHLTRLKKQRPDVVLIGNSMVYTRFDLELLNKLVRPAKVAVISVGGSKSAVWYAQFKHSVVASGVRPNRVVFFFRGRELTPSVWAAEGPEAERLQRATRGRDAVIEAKLGASVKGSSDEVRSGLARLVPVEDLRASSWEQVDGLALRFSDTLAQGPSGEKRKAAINGLFGVEALRPDPERTIEVDETPSSYSGLFARSFLPDILELAEKNGISLAFARVKTRRDAARQSETGERAAYYAALRAYLERRGATFVDLTTNRWEKLELYGSGDHIASRHRPAYTRRFVRQYPELFREGP